MEKRRARRNEQKRKQIIIAILSVIVIVSLAAGVATGFKPKGTLPKKDGKPAAENIVVEENQEDSAQTEEAVNALVRQGTGQRLPVPILIQLQSFTRQIR